MWTPVAVVSCLWWLTVPEWGSDGVKREALLSYSGSCYSHMLTSPTTASVQMAVEKRKTKKI